MEPTTKGMNSFELISGTQYPKLTKPLRTAMTRSGVATIRATMMTRTLLTMIAPVMTFSRIS